MPPKAIGLYHTHEHLALRSGSELFANPLKRRGYDVELIDLSAADGPGRLHQALNGNDIAFAFGVQGIGSRLEAGGVNLWTARRLPFICLHFDNPCYNPYNHFNESRFVGNVYFFESFLEARNKYLPGGQLSVAAPFQAYSWSRFEHPPWEKRPIRLLFLKGGADTGELTAYFDSLPPKIRDGVYQQLERTEKSPNLSLFDLADEIFTACGLDRKAAERSFWGLVQSMDYYVRRRRAITMVEWLKHQEGAVIVGDGWDFIDKDGARAVFKPARDVYKAGPLYAQSQFICNTSPYGRDHVHERVMLGLLCRCAVLSDANAWWDERFVDLPGLTRFTYDRDLESQLRPTLANPGMEACARAAQTRAAEIFVNGASIDYLPAFAEQVGQFAAD